MNELSLDLVDWDEAGQITDGMFYPPPLAIRESELDLLSEHDDGSESRSRASSFGTGAPSSMIPEPFGDEGQSKKRKGRKQESEEEKKKRRAIVAAASRATRAKRKREKEDLKQRNEKLEKDRQMYLSKIAQLQTEVQAARDAGAINLTKENELLRTEIRKHKAFIYKLVAATESIPSITEEEKYRMVKSGSDSACGQVVGLATTSIADPTWVDGFLNGFDGSQVRVRLQKLPHGCDNESMRRLNLRIDMPDREEDIETLREHLWLTWTDQGLCERLMREISRQDIRIHLKEIETNFADVDQDSNNFMKVYYYNEDSDEPGFTKKDSVFVLSWQKTNVFHASFPTIVNGVVTEEKPEIAAYEAVDNGKDDPFSAYVLSSATTMHQDVNLKPEQTGVQRIKSPLIEGHILRRAPNGGSHWTVVYSVPMDDITFAGVSKSDLPLVNPDMTLGIQAQAALHTMMQILAELKAKKQQQQQT